MSSAEEQVKGTPATEVVRIVVDGWTWVQGDDNTCYAKRMLSDALESNRWPQKRVDVTITPGGFIRARFPREFEVGGGKCGWGSDDCFKQLIEPACNQVERVIENGRMIDRFKQHTRFLTLGVDLIGGRCGMHAELVAVLDTEAGKVIEWTGKSYPAGDQEDDLVQAPLDTHLMELDGKPMLILGCHDLTMFSNRNWSGTGCKRRNRKTEMRKLAKEFKPLSVLQHPHLTDLRKTWSGGWSGVRTQLPWAKTRASGIAYCYWDRVCKRRAPPRESLDNVLEGTAWGDHVTDIVVKGPKAGDPAIANRGSKFAKRQGKG